MTSHGRKYHMVREVQSARSACCAVQVSIFPGVAQKSSTPLRFIYHFSLERQKGRKKKRKKDVHFRGSSSSPLRGTYYPETTFSREVGRVQISPTLWSQLIAVGPGICQWRIAHVLERIVALVPRTTSRQLSRRADARTSLKIEVKAGFIPLPSKRGLAKPRCLAPVVSHRRGPSSDRRGSRMVPIRCPCPLRPGPSIPAGTPSPRPRKFRPSLKLRWRWVINSERIDDSIFNSWTWDRVF